MESRLLEVHGTTKILRGIESSRNGMTLDEAVMISVITHDSFLRMRGGLQFKNLAPEKKGKGRNRLKIQTCIPPEIEDKCAGLL